MNYTIIVAVAENQAIGLDGKLAWHLPNDLRFFKEKTRGFPVVMGRKTFESIGKPLPDRENVVVTGDRSYSRSGLRIVHSLEEAWESVSESSTVFLIGGETLYREALEKNAVGSVWVTRVHAYPIADKFFPELDTKVWQKKWSSERMPTDEKHVFEYTFEFWEKKTN
jgi:dihydrofolate reductase